MSKETLMCIRCAKEKEKKNNYYNTSNKMYSNIGKLPLCKTCMKEMVNLEDMETVYSILRQFDIMFHIDYWNSAVESKFETFGRYMTMANSMPQFEDTGWNDSVFTPSTNTKKSEKIEPLILEVEVPKIDSEELDELKEKYGHGYPDEEYILFEKRFRKLQPSFQLPTTMHEEYLREYCVNKVKETIAKAKGEFKEAKEWAAMAKDAADAGKLKPSQMSKADLSSGLDGFGQLSRMVEQKQDIIPLLPKFIQQPKDKVDVTLWLYVNYIRDLQGLPEAEYEDIYSFYNDRKADYESRELDIELTPTEEEDNE